MKLINLTFRQWLNNHDPDHDDKWCRELYPFTIFRFISFDENQLNKEQKIEFNQVTYFIILTKIELQENGRYRTTFDIATFPKTKTQEWKQRKWNTTFQIVYTQDYQFITIFAKREDPSRDYVIRFMKGNFHKINENRSIPISELLIRTLILHIAEEGFIGGSHSITFKFLKNGVRELKGHSQFKRKNLDFAPIYSIERDLWICYSFTEEKAHRTAFYYANQCRKLIVVYCNPTYMSHHRCQYPETFIISIFELSNLASPEVRKKYEGQIRFLQNHLNKHEKLDSQKLLNEINNPLQEIYEIKKSELMEALGIMKIHPQNEEDFFHSLCAINLVNAYLGRQRANKEIQSKESKLFRNMYYFKTYLSEILTERIRDKNYTVPIYMTKNLIIVEILGFQFSFHSIPLNETLTKFTESQYNKEILWKGKRLQPIASLLLNYSRAIRHGE
ncbi:MAG: hypothetical protein Q8T04_06820 [Bacteroidota bacterium]|nr:hypothetical protein [Bacteroidota bacterium]